LTVDGGALIGAGFVEPPRAVAAYLRDLRAVLAEAIESRRAWVRELGALADAARRQQGGLIAERAELVGRRQTDAFGAVGARLARLGPPADCDACHRAVVSWLGIQLAACAVMVEVGEKGDAAGLRRVQRVLADGRPHARRFNAEYRRMVDDLAALVRRAEARAAAREGARRARPRRSAPADARRR
jgi:hypothetical protein